MMSKFSADPRKSINAIPLRGTPAYEEYIANLNESQIEAVPVAPIV